MMILNGVSAEIVNTGQMWQRHRNWEALSSSTKGYQSHLHSFVKQQMNDNDDKMLCALVQPSCPACKANQLPQQKGNLHAPLVFVDAHSNVRASDFCDGAVCLLGSSLNRCPRVITDLD